MKLLSQTTVAVFLAYLIAPSAGAAPSPLYSSSKASGKTSIKKSAPKLAERVRTELSEDQLYVRVLQDFRGRDLVNLRASAQRFVKAYPQSPFADNSLFLMGQLNLQSQKYTEAIRNFQQIADQYPRGNKVVSALFAKAQAYKKLNLFDFAEKTFRRVKKDFPGSPEADRCDIELKLIEIRQNG